LYFGSFCELRDLLLKQILKRLSRVRGPSGGNRRRCGIRVRHRRSILLNRHPKFIKWAIVSRVFLSNPLGNRLHAFKPRAGIEKAALFAAVKFKLATRALPIQVRPGSQYRAAIRASCARYASHHARRSRPHLIWPWPRLRWTPLAPALFIFFVAVAVAALLILPLHQLSPRDAQSYSESRLAIVNSMSQTMFYQGF
jgi:hypothetical protein